MTCTAPVWGHRRARAWSRCPECRGGRGWAAPSSVTTTTPTITTKSATSSRSQVTTPKPAGRQFAGITNEVQHRLVDSGLNAADSRSFISALVGLAGEMQSGDSSDSASSHWLCQVLATAAEAIDPGSVASTTGRVSAEVHIPNGMPNSAGMIAGRGVAVAVEGAISSLMQNSQLCLELRVLALLVCPAPRKCPADNSVSIPILRETLGATS